MGAQVAFSLFTDLEDFIVSWPGPKQGQAINATLDQVVAGAGALATLRARW